MQGVSSCILQLKMWSLWAFQTFVQGQSCKRRGQLTTLTSGITTSASLCGAMLGSLAAFLLKDRAGRRTELFYSAAAYGARPCLECGSTHCALEMLPLMNSVLASVHVHLFQDEDRVC